MGDALDEYPSTDRWTEATESGVRATMRPPLAPCALPTRASAEPARYETRALLGRGGMGDVHACEDRRIGRTVAKKTLRARLGEVSATRRFVDEARLQGRLEHPAIVPVYDLGTDENGAPFFTMKRVRGETLAQVLAARRAGHTSEWSTRRLLSAVCTVALAIDYAHRRGVVHGDLKPGNVMLGRFGEVHVLDWGCATEVRPDSEGALAEDLGPTTLDVRTLAGLSAANDSRSEILGTPGYLAPEQARGERGVPASDVYALGAMLFEVIAGEPLHRGTTPLALLVSSIAGVPRRPSQRAAGVHVPLELDELVERATEREPELRPSAREVAACIEHVLDVEAAELGARRTAARHAEDARDASRRALEQGDETARITALREAARALALDPENEAATDVIAKLLVQPPSELPPEAREEMVSLEREVVARAVGSIGVRTMTWLAFIPLCLALGVRSLVGASITIALMVLAAFAFAMASRRPTTTPRERMALLALVLAAVACFAGMFGPFVIVPLFATTTVTMMAVGLDARQRLAAIALGLTTIAAPLVLELAHVIPPSVAFVDGGILILPRFTGFPPGATLALLVIAHAVALPMCVAITGKLWDAMDRARRRLALRTWQLERALPKRVATVPPAA
jgi:serine/threonine-protein kinase